MKCCFFILLWLNLITFAGSHAFAQEPVLHLVSIIDTNSDQRGADIGPGCENNQKELEVILGEIFVKADDHNWVDRLKVNVLRGEQVDPKNIVSFVENLEIRANIDVVFFYYCGHGVTDGTDTHVFATSGGDIPRMTIRKAMLAKKAKLAIIVSDTCSSFSASNPGIPARRVPAKWKPFKQLFFESDGLVDFTAASFGEFAWFTGEGGFFSRSLFRLFCEPMDTLDYSKDGRVTWKELFLVAKTDTSKAFGVAKQKASAEADIRKSKDQSPAWWYLADKPSYARPVVFVNKTDESVSVRSKFRTENADSILEADLKIAPQDRAELKVGGDAMIVGRILWEGIGATSGRNWGSGQWIEMNDPYYWRTDETEKIKNYRIFTIE